MAGASRTVSIKAAFRVIAVGQRLPAWVYETVNDYSKRLPPQWGLEWHEVKAATRDSTATAAQWMQREAQAIEAALPERALKIILDEKGRDLTTPLLAERMKIWQASGRFPCLIIGGPDGLDSQLKAGADESFRLSSMTLPHPLVRVILAEQIYRAWSILAGHPYHRD